MQFFTAMRWEDTLLAHLADQLWKTKKQFHQSGHNSSLLYQEPIGRNG